MANLHRRNKHGLARNISESQRYTDARPDMFAKPVKYHKPVKVVEFSKLAAGDSFTLHCLSDMTVYIKTGDFDATQNGELLSTIYPRFGVYHGEKSPVKIAKFAKCIMVDMKRKKFKG